MLTPAVIPHRGDCIYVDFRSGKRYKPSRAALFEYRVNLQTKYRSNFCRAAATAATFANFAIALAVAGAAISPIIVLFKMHC